MKTDMPEIGKILDNAFAMGKSPTPSDYQELKSGMVAKITELTLKQVMELIGEDVEVPRPVGNANTARFYRRSGQNFLKKQLRQSAERIWK